MSLIIFKSQKVQSMRIYNCKDISYMLPNCLLVKLPHLMILLGVYENIILSHSYKVPYIFVYIDGQLKSKKKKTLHNFIMLMVISLLSLRLNCFIYLLAYVCIYFIFSSPLHIFNGCQNIFLFICKNTLYNKDISMVFIYCQYFCQFVI